MTLPAPSRPPADVGHAGPPRGRPAAGHLIRVFEYEPDLLAGVDPAAAAVLGVRGIARGVTLESGPWAPPEAAKADALGLLVLDGLLTRCVSVLGRESPELLGSGDLLRPWDLQAPGSGAVDERVAWRALTPVRLAVLDGRFASVVATHPSVIAALLARVNARTRALAFTHALANIRHAETRLLMVLWHLADRWGRVTPGGVVLELPLTHELLAHLTAMRRPTASTALRRLIGAGSVQRDSRTRWILHGRPPEADGNVNGVTLPDPG